MAVCAWKILHDEVSRRAFSQVLKAATLFTFIGLVGVMGSGHFHAQYMVQANPMKLSSMEALWETEDPAPFAVFADIDQEKHQNTSEILVPHAFSFMLYNKPTGEVKGINTLQQEQSQLYGPGEYRPDVAGLFWSFRTMLAAGGLMMLAVLVTGFLAWKDRPLAFPAVLRLLPWLLPLPFIANSVGWFITESGRQPWIVVGLQRTADAVSPNLTSTDVWLTMIGFTVLYLLLAVAALYIAVRFIRHTSVQSEEGSDI